MTTESHRCINVRPATELDDEDDIVRIVGLAFRGRWSVRLYREFMSEDGAAGYVATCDGSTVAVMLVQFHSDHVHIALIATHPEFQSSGVGSLMLDWLKMHLSDFGCATIKLHCRANNPAANRFYLANGYQEEARLPGEYHDGVDAVVYKYTAGALTPAKKIGD